MKKNFVFILFLLLSLTGFSQSRAVLFTIDDVPFYSDEFVRVYQKNLDLVKDDSQKDLNAYMDLYVAYKLKVQKALKLGLNNEEKYQKELASYRKQLAKKYLNDSEVTEKLVQEAYERIKEEIRASHILVLVKENGTPEDTLLAFRKIESYYNEIKKGGDFAEIAFHKSEDPSAKQNKGDLGYFSAFRMVYPFENAAYNTPVGSVSKPFRTQFGYHLIQTTDRRPNQGDVQVAHIILFKNQDNAVKNDFSEKRDLMKSIYEQYLNGESFESLARQFSEDKSTNQVGGEMPKFSSGQLASIEFENVAFGLQNPGDVSEPFETDLGFHLVKLIKKHPLEDISKLRQDIENNVKRDERSLLIETSLSDKLKLKYEVTRFDAELKKITPLITADFFEGKWNKPENFSRASNTFININGVAYTNNSFLDFLLKQQKRNSFSKHIPTMLSQAREAFIDTEIKAYYDGQLENEFVEFHYIMEEYRDGLLLFDLMEKEIWEKSKNDSIGLEHFYNANKENYRWKKRYGAVLFSSKDKKALKSALKLYKKGISKDSIKKSLNADNATLVKITEGVFEEDFADLKNYSLEKLGVNSIFENNDGYFGVADVKAILQPSYKTIDECKGRLTSDYQQELESNWVASLKNEFDVKINTKEFESVKQQLK